MLKHMPEVLHSNIVLIGMPGCGKSTIGIMLAKQMALEFIDTDVLIQAQEGQKLQDIIDQRGHEVLKHIEEQVILGLNLRNHVIATGGSAAYSESAMGHLARTGRIVYMDVDLPEIRRRLGDFGTRGIARRPEQSLEALFEERTALYRSHAAIHVDCNGLGQEAACAKIITHLSTAR